MQAYRLTKMQFNHSVVLDIDPVGITYHTTTAQKMSDGTYVVVARNQETGAVHQRYFDTLREFVLWHYDQQGVLLGLRDLPWEEEVY